MNAQQIEFDSAIALCKLLRSQRKGYPLGVEAWRDRWAEAYLELKWARHQRRLLASAPRS